MDNSREEEFEKFARWYALPLDKSEDGIYLALETQSAWVACQNWQAKVEELEQELESERAEQIKGYSKISDLRLEREELQKRVESLRRKQKAAEKLIWKWAESTECAHFALQCASELKEALEVRDAPVLEAEGRFYAIGLEGWIPGIYASREAAELAYAKKDISEFLEKLASEINQKQGRDITLGDLEQALKGEG